MRTKNKGELRGRSGQSRTDFILTFRFARLHRMRIQLFFLTLLMGICGCSRDTSPEVISSWQEVSGRNEASSLERYPVYRLKISSQWKRLLPPSDVSILDTTQPLCSWTLETEQGTILATLHNFPTDSVEMRIPPQAQIDRWKRQFAQIALTDMTVTPQAYSGFVGYFFEGTGILKGEESTMMAWAMQLAPEHWRRLQSYQLTTTPKGKLYLQQMQADFTLKVVGPAKAIALHRPEIKAIGRSLELLQDLPSPL